MRIIATRLATSATSSPPFHASRPDNLTAVRPRYSTRMLNAAMQTFKQETSLDFSPAAAFTRDTLEKRSELFYAITKKIWQV